MSTFKVLFVCTGNTCRSPMAAALAADIWLREGVAAEVFSAGIHANGRMRASGNSINAMKKMGLDISAHKSQNVSADLIKDMDLVLTLTDGHKEMLVRIYRDEAAKVYSLAEYSGSEFDVEDPFGMDAETYVACAEQIKEMIESCTEKIKAAV